MVAAAHLTDVSCSIEQLIPTDCKTEYPSGTHVRRLCELLSVDVSLMRDGMFTPLASICCCEPSDHGRSANGTRDASESLTVASVRDSMKVRLSFAHGHVTSSPNTACSGPFLVPKDQRS
jgi:hypothetical protein